MASKYDQFIHPWIRGDGQIRYAVGRYNEGSGQYTVPMLHYGRILSGGASHWFAHRPCDLPSFKTLRQARRRARYLYGDHMDDERRERRCRKEQETYRRGA